MVRKLLNLILIFVCLSWGASRAWAAKDFNIKNNAQSFFYLNGTSGNVGIGSVSPGQKLDIQGTVRTIGFTMSGQTPISGYVLTASDSAGDTTWTSGPSVSGWTVSGINVYESLGGNVGIGTTNITTAGLTVMNGNVGIGTWVPSTALYVNGAIGASNNILTNPTGSTTAAPRLFGFSPSFAAGQAAQIQFGDVSNVLQNGYGDRMQLSAYWGIEVRGNAEATAPAFVGGTAADAALEVFAPSTATSNTLSLVNGTGTIVYDVFGSTGNVGIGSVSPGQKLDVQGTVRTAFFTMSGQTPISGYVLTASDSAGDTTWTSGPSVSGWTVSGNNVYEALGGNVGIGTFNPFGGGLIVTNGNVGIGSLTPGQKVDVQGTVRALYFVGNGAGLTGLSASGWSQSGTDIYTTTGSDNVGIGTSIPGNKLDVVGGNIGIGTGYNLVGIGTTSTILTLRNDTSSIYLGWQSGASTTVLGFNTAVGNQSLMSNTTGTGNTAAGYNALNSNTTGAVNTAMGYNALGNNTIGTSNAAFGDAAGAFISNGVIFNQTSTNSVYLGYLTESLASGDTNETVIGYNAAGIGSNTVELGNSSVVTTQLQGNVGIGTFVPKNRLDIVGGNIGIGTTYNLVGIGTTSTILTLRADTSSVYLGWQAGASTTGAFLNNTAVGYQALTNITLGNDNAALGYSALVSNTSGIGNSALGWDALFSNTTGIENAAVGQNSLVSNTTGNQNTAMGYAALNRITSGSVNSALGVQAGMFISGSITGNQTSSNSLYLGYNTEALADGDTNETVIGYSAVGLGSNTVELGNSSVVTTQLQGNVGIGTFAPNGKLIVLGGNVGIGTGTPSAKMQVSGQYNSIRVNNGNQPGASMTVDWNNGNVQAVTLTGAITTLTLNNPVAGGRYLLEIKQGGAGSFTIAWPASVNWPSGTAPTLTATAGQSDIITLYYNGTNYAGFYSLNYSI